MSILVAGGAGYIGSHTARALHASGADVVVLDTLEHGFREAVPGMPMVQASISDGDAVTATCKEYGVTQAIHFAAYKSVGESMEQPTKYWVNNVAGSALLADALLAAGVEQVVFSSSCSVNGTPRCNDLGFLPSSRQSSFSFCSWRRNTSTMAASALETNTRACTTSCREATPPSSRAVVRASELVRMA